MPKSGSIVAAAAIMSFILATIYQDGTSGSLLYASRCGISEGRLIGQPSQICHHAGKPPKSHSVTQDLSLVGRGNFRKAGSYASSGKNWDKSIDSLEMVVERNPHDSAALNNLAVAYLARADLTGEGLDYLHSLAAIEKARSLNPESKEIKYNRALIFEKFQLVSLARAAWGLYLDEDAYSPWAEEARTHLRLLPESSKTISLEKLHRLLSDVAIDNGKDVASTVADSSQLSREYVEEYLLYDWARKREAGDRGAASRIESIARKVGYAIYRREGDHMISDAVAAIEAAEEDRDPEMLRYLVEGHLAYGEGLRLFQSGDMNKASNSFKKAADALAHGGSPFHLWANFYDDVIFYYIPDYRRSFSSLQSLLGQLERYPVLQGRTQWVMGLAQKELGNFSDALVYYRKALIIFASMGEAENTAAMYNLISGLFDSLGNTREAWNYRFKSLRLIPKVYSPRRLHNIWGMTAEALARQGEPEIALIFQDMVVGNARHNSEPLLTAIALWQRAALYNRIGDVNSAIADIKDSELQCAQLKDERVQRELLSDVRLVKAETYRLLDPAQAERDLTDSIEFYSGTEYHFRLAEAYKKRAGIYMLQNKRDIAVQDLESGIREIEKVRSNLERGEDRSRYLEQSEDIFDGMVGLQVSLGNYRAALEYAERGRARAMLDYFAQINLTAEERSRILNASPQPMKLEEIQASIPASFYVVEYGVLGGSTLAWVVSRDNIVMIRLPAETPAIETTVNELADARRQGAVARFNDLSSHLRSLLFAPISSFVRKGSTLVFVLDKILKNIPFSTLWDRESGRYLVEDYAVEIAPSATLFSLALQREGELSCGPPVSAVAAGNPDFDRNLFPSLSTLPGAEIEVEDAFLACSNTNIMRGREATKERFLQEIQGKDMIVFAGHASINKRLAALNSLLFASSEASSGVLSLPELYGLRLPDARLVVLSACGSAERSINREDLSSFAEAFLAAGVPAVVASFWDVSDMESESLLRQFYLNLGKGQAPISALRNAQLKLLRGRGGTSGEPFAWGAFAFFGGSKSEKCKEIQ